MLTGHCAYSLGCERWKNGCGQCPDLDIYPAIERDATATNWRRKRRIYERSRLYVSTPSQWLMDCVSDSMLRGVEYKVIPNSVDQKLFTPGNQAEARSALHLPADLKTVLLSAHNSFKDYDMMEASLKQVNLNDGKEIMIICLGKTGESKSLRNGRVVYPGFIRKREQIVQYYRAADIFLHAAKDEAFGKTIIEAMACGVPVVATNTGGIREIIEDGKTGFLVPHGDTRGMSEAIEYLLTETDHCYRMGKSGVEDVSRRFGLDRQVDAFLAWYKEILHEWWSTHPSQHVIHEFQQ